MLYSQAIEPRFPWDRFHPIPKAKHVGIIRPHDIMWLYFHSITILMTQGLKMQIVHDFFAQGNRVKFEHCRVARKILKNDIVAALSLVKERLA